MDIQPGTTVTIMADVVIGGVVAFSRGEQVRIEQLTPNPAAPEYKYVVTSLKTGQRYQLRDVDVSAPGELMTTQMPGAVPPPGSTAPMPAPGAPAGLHRQQTKGKKGGKKQKGAKGPGPAKASGGGVKVLAVILAILLIAAIAGLVILYMKYNDTKKKDKAQIESLQKEVKSKSTPSQSTTSSSPVGSSSTAPAGSSATSSATSSGTPAQTVPGQTVPGQTQGPSTATSDAATLNTMADAEAAKLKSSSNKPWTHVSPEIISGWARIGFGGGPTVQGFSAYYHKVNGQWKWVTEGTGIEPSDVPGCPPQLLK